MQYIYFYGHSNKHDYNYLSNFYLSSFKDNNIIYTCSEQYFMKKKQELFNPNNLNLATLILQTKEPSKIKKLGRQVQNFDQVIWDSNKYRIMLAGLNLKFTQDENLKKMLIATWPNMLVEAAENDKIWGIGLNVEDAVKLNDPNKWKGLNLLGKALVETRNNIMKK
jgi:ribA/ribD-fused uncharacterized protein